MIEKARRNEILNWVDLEVEDALLRTFLTLWNERHYWDFKPIIYRDPSTKEILGFCAYAVNDKYKDTLKIYYLFVLEKHRGKGISKLLLEECFKIAKELKLSNFLYVSDSETDGFKIFKDTPFETKDNEFSGKDYIFNISTKRDKLFK